MKRLTTDNPQDNLENALNLFYVKGGWTWVRGYDPGPGSEDISLNDLVRLIAEQHGLDIAQSKDDEKISEEMAELLMDMTDTPEGVVALLYCAAWVCAELRDRLMKYEDTKMTPQEITAAANRRHDCKIDCLLEAHNKLLDEIEQLGGMEEIRRAVHERPKHGTWYGEGDGYADGEVVYDVWECSQCGHIIDDGTDDPEGCPITAPTAGQNGGLNYGKQDQKIQRDHGAL